MFPPHNIILAVGTVVYCVIFVTGVMRVGLNAESPLAHCQRRLDYGIERIPMLALSNGGRFDAHFFSRSTIGAAAFDTLFSDAVEGIKTFFGDIAEVSVVRSQCGVIVVQEELRTVGVGTSVCHSN